MSHPRLGRRSISRLETCHPELMRLAKISIKVGMDFSVLQGWRGEERQNDLYSQGLSQKRWPDSKHNRMNDGRPYSLAIDIAPWYESDPHIRWDNVEEFYYLAGIFRAVAFDLSIPIRWGGDWNRNFNLRDQSFFDLGHFELVV